MGASGVDFAERSTSLWSNDLRRMLNEGETGPQHGGLLAHVCIIHGEKLTGTLWMHSMKGMSDCCFA